jgi:hypothetical protein
MAKRRLSATTRKEVLDLANEAVPRTLKKEVTLSWPDFSKACRGARATLAAATKAWQDGGKPSSGKLYTDMVTAAVSAEVMCAFAGE